MRCKPGDLAIVVREVKHARTEMLGKVCRVIAAAPVGVVFKLPDGYPSEKIPTSGFWIVDFPTGIEVETACGEFRKTHYAAIRDSMLRPIRDPGEDASDETMQWLPAPLTREPEAA